MTTWRRRVAWAALPALGLTLGACGNSGNGTASSTTVSTAAGGGHNASGPTTTTGVPTSVANQDAIRKDVTMSSCSGTAGGWSAGGVVKNSQGHDVTYHITVFFTSAQATDLAYGVTSVPVGAGGSTLWSVSAKFAAPTTVLCVLRGVAAS